VVANAKGRIAGFDFSLNPYGGDGAESRLRQGLALGFVRREARLAGSSIYLGSASEPYGEAEEKAEVTRRILVHLVELDPQPRLVIQTNSPLVLRDIRLLKKFKNVRVNIVVRTDDESVREQYEPSAPSIDSRFRTAEKLIAEGISTAICVAAMLPVRSAHVLAERIQEVGPDIVTTSWRGKPLRGQRQPDWSREQYWEVCDVLRSRLPQFRSSVHGFSPTGEQRPWSA
jgi:DNA repair photolyase